MEKPEENAEKKEETAETTKKPVKIDGISSQINLGQGTPAHQQWARIMVTSGHSSPSACLKMMMDAYENPVSNADDAATIKELSEEIKRNVGEFDSLNAIIKQQDEEIEQLKTKLEAANKTANENAVNGLGKQAQIEDLQKQLTGAIVIKPNPVVKYFLDEMSKETGKTPAEILQSLYIDDLQNPRANNLPYTVSSSRIRKVMEDLKPKDNA